MSTVFRLNNGDLQPSLQATLLKSDNTPLNLTGASVLFKMSQKGITLLSNPTIIIDTVQGIVQYNWQPGDTNQYGSCKGVFIVTFPGGAIQSFPVASELNIVFPQNYPQFTTLDEIISHLNISGPNDNGNFTLFGLPISTSSVQAQVDHANKYVSSLVPSLQEGSVDPRLVSAELAAADLACLGVLVAVVGGSLIGAYDYSLGDIHVSRAGPYATAIKTAIDGYRNDAIANLMNISTVATAVNSSRHFSCNDSGIWQ